MKTEDLVKKAIYTLLRKYGNMKKAAEALNLGRTTLDSALNKGSMNLSTFNRILNDIEFELELVKKQKNQ